MLNLEKLKISTKQVKVLLFLTITLLICVSPNGNARNDSEEIFIDSLKNKEVFCLAQNIFWEARGESFDEKIRISNVTHNRVKSGRFPNSFCSVIHQKNAFSWVDDKKNLNKTILRSGDEYKAWLESMQIAIDEVAGKMEDTTNGSLFFHSIHIEKPKDFPGKLTLVSETHKFYK
jgi:spore germination cell wall hydrolase CwlJ-like protein